jgi:hypothetical protein
MSGLIVPSDHLSKDDKLLIAYGSFLTILLVISRILR